MIDKEGKEIGIVTSGGPAPTLKKAVGMAYVDAPFNKVNTDLFCKVRDKQVPIKTKKMPFVPSNYYKPWLN